MKYFKAESTFDKIFETGIILKGIDGLIETIGGLFLILVDPKNISGLISWLTRSELTHDHHDFIANHLSAWGRNLTRGTLLFFGIYLLVHGVAKLILVIEILRQHLWAYIGLIVLTVIFIIYQTYEIIFTHSLSMTLLTLFDIVVVYLTTIEYKKQHLALMKKIKLN
jgi:uncharacterized membrane protein